MLTKAYKITFQSTCNLLRSLCGDAGIETPQNVDSYEEPHDTAKDHKWLAKTCKKRIIVCNDSLTISEVINKITGTDVERCATKGIHESLVLGDNGRGDWDSGLVLDVTVIALVRVYTINGTQQAGLT